MAEGKAPDPGKWKQLFKQLTINHWFYVPNTRWSHYARANANWKISRACTLSPRSPSNVTQCQTHYQSTDSTWLSSILWSKFPPLSFALHFSYHSPALHGYNTACIQCHWFPSRNLARVSGARCVIPQYSQCSGRRQADRNFRTTVVGKMHPAERSRKIRSTPTIPTTLTQ